MKKLVLALGLVGAAMNVSAAEEVAAGLLGGAVPAVVATVVVAGVAVAAADNNGNKGTSGTVAP